MKNAITNQHKTLIILNLKTYEQYGVFKFCKFKFWKYISVFLVCFGIYIDVLSVLWDSVSFSVYMNVFKNMFLFFRLNVFFRIRRTFVCNKMVLNTPPIPIPGVSKSLLPGGNEIIKNNIFDDFPLFLWKKSKKLRYQGA